MSGSGVVVVGSFMMDLVVRAPRRDRCEKYQRAVRSDRTQRRFITRHHDRDIRLGRWGWLYVRLERVDSGNADGRAGGNRGARVETGQQAWRRVEFFGKPFER